MAGDRNNLSSNLKIHLSALSPARLVALPLISALSASKIIGQQRALFHNHNVPGYNSTLRSLAIKWRFENNATFGSSYVTGGQGSLVAVQ
jgi:hypothetical protein